MNINISKVNRKLKSGDHLSNLPLILHNSILNWETNQRINGDKFFQGYEELSAMLNIHPQTLRKYTNVHNPQYPPVNTLLTACKIMNDFQSWEYLNEGLK